MCVISNSDEVCGVSVFGCEIYNFIIEDSISSVCVCVFRCVYFEVWRLMFGTISISSYPSALLPFLDQFPSRADSCGRRNDKQSLHWSRAVIRHFE